MAHCGGTVAAKCDYAFR